MEQLTAASIIFLYDKIIEVKRENETMQKRIHVLESDLKARKLRRVLLAWFLALYPVIFVVFFASAKMDHKKINEISSDLAELLKDVHALSGSD